YLPKCNPSCNTGKCVNDNVCDCRGTLFKGQYCNEYYLIKRYKIVDNFLIILLFALSVLSVILIFAVIIYRKKSLIKQSGYDFLILILIGTIFNYLHCYFFTKDISRIYECYLNQIFLSIGYSFIYVSILVKTLRIYKIFKGRVKIKKGLKKTSMYFIILGFILIQLAIISLWKITDSVLIENKLTNDNQMYNECYYPLSNKINIIIRFIILFIGSYLAYEIRNVPNNFKEDLAVPVYICCLMNIFSDIYSRLNITKRIEDFFNGITVITYTFIVIWFLYINKFYKL
ncbi:hypothetical protein BCR36DRAFT_240425, partial [Piromyces finnis]